MTRGYRVASISKDNGYGMSVIAKLKETKVKRNLYYEIKDRVLEETTDGTKIIRNKRKTKVFGLYSNKEIRDQLIEILRERMNLHKDKFISPTIYQELRGLEVKRNGKVEHSELTHDDQIFSYLMALYVWYEGKNLRELFGIEKGSIKTEESVDDIVSLEGAEDYGDITQEIVYITKDGNQKLDNDLKDMQYAKGVLYSEFIEKERKHDMDSLKAMLNDPVVRKAYANKYKIPEDSVGLEDGTHFGPGTISGLPQSVFFDFNKDLTEMDRSSIYHTLNADMYTYDNNKEDNGLQ